jgi:fructokinase
MQNGSPAIFGEVLLDHYPDGQKTLGGAPFNVAWHLHGFGTDPHLISAVGTDQEASTVFKAFDGWGLCRRFIETVAEKPTGSVLVTLDQGIPDYQIGDSQAFDSISAGEFIKQPPKTNLLYHGSLAYRSNHNRAALQKLVTATNAPRFVDLNIRLPHFKTAWLAELIGGATWIKLNDEELQLISGVKIDTQRDAACAVGTLVKKYGNATYFITLGPNGAYAIEDGQLSYCPAHRIDSVTDTVGAGDAFTAATIAGVLQSLPTQTIMAGASRLASRICAIPGAVSRDRSIYNGVFQ